MTNLKGNNLQVSERGENPVTKPLMTQSLRVRNTVKVSTVGLDEEQIQKYVKWQLQKDKAMDQLKLWKR